MGGNLRINPIKIFCVYTLSYFFVASIIDIRVIYKKSHSNIQIIAKLYKIYWMNWFFITFIVRNKWVEKERKWHSLLFDIVVVTRCVEGKSMLILNQFHSFFLSFNVTLQKICLNLLPFYVAFFHKRGHATLTTTRMIVIMKS